MNVTSCVTPALTCSSAVPTASCASVHFDPADPCWEGAFDGLTFDGGADPVGWLSARSWLWRPLRDVVVALRASLRERYGAPAAFRLEAQWYDGGTRPAVALYVSAPVFPYVRHGYDPAVSDAEVFFVVGEDGEEPPPHAALVAALERPVFDGHPALDRIRVSVCLMAPPPEPTLVTADIRMPTRIDEYLPETPDLVEQVKAMCTKAMKQEEEAALRRDLRGKSSTGDAG